MPSDTKFFEQIPRAVTSAMNPTLRCPVVTFHYNDGSEHEIVCLTDEDVARAQHIADRLGVRF